MSAAHSTLSRRDREILKDVIHTYLLTAEPVSSRTVAKHEQHDLSAATIRNIMADLDEGGYLTQPHTSAGRVPTPLGYHFFIDALMDEERVDDEDARVIDAHLAALRDGEELATAATHLLSELSKQVGIVVIPSMGSATLKAIEFAPLSENRVLCIMVSTNGFIENKVIETRTPLRREELIRLSNYLTENFTGLGLEEIRDRLLAILEDERAEMDELLKYAVDLVQPGLEGRRGSEVLYDGTSSILNQPELADLARVQRLFDTFSDRTRLIQLLNQCLDGEGVRVWIGDESELTSELDFSLIAARYGGSGRDGGTLGVFGPSRMPYSRLIPLVEYLGQRLSEALARTM